MSVESFIGFLRGMGHKVRELDGSFWYNVFPHVYQNFPFHKTVDAKSLNVKRVLAADGIVARFSCSVQAGRPSYRLACRDKAYGLSSLSQKARNQTRRGLDHCTVRPIHFEELQESGLRLNRETLERQGRAMPPDFSTYWKKYYSLARKAEGAEAWGSFIQGRLAAYLIAFQLEECNNVFIVRSSAESLRFYANNALLFTFIKHALQRPDTIEVSIGLESLQHGMESLDHFKLGMGFEKISVGQRIEFAAWLRPLMCRPVTDAILRVMQGRIDNEKYGKAAGMLQLYTEQPVLKRRD